MKMIVEGIMDAKLPWVLVFMGVFLALALEVLRVPVMPFAIGLYLPIYLSLSLIHICIPADQIKKAIALGVSKINVNTECQLAFADATRKYIEAGKDLEGKGFDPRKLLAPGAEAIKATVKEKMELFGSVNKA